ncbi:hypothetical protein CLV59_103312 [Chitinophaga dinghuensis]|uniref:Uncharacterized protein n=1 Tax=Chitinophaga dinghuensis TaxID=1539050 RepID=A0A327W4P8_9BACT|nr:hypothetical protein CLV59_103312 [Chitinophaga dinghuensis]
MYYLTKSICAKVFEDKYPGEQQQSSIRLRLLVSRKGRKGQRIMLCCLIVFCFSSQRHIYYLTTSICAKVFEDKYPREQLRA